MNKLFLVLMIVMIMPVCYGTTTRTNTTITLDYVGNDMFYLRTETGDHLLNATDQSDKTFSIEILRETADNLTDYERVVSYLSSINQTCYSLSTDYNFSTKYATQTSLYDNCTLTLDNCISQRDVYKTHLGLAEQAQASYVANITSWQNDYITCTNDRTQTNTILVNCQNQLNNISTDYNNYKSTTGSGFNNGVFLGFFVTGIIAIIIISRYAQKNRPKTIREYGYADQP